MPEYLDLLDSRGNSLGRTKIRDAVHRDGDWHRTFHLWIVNQEGQLLLQRRAAAKDSYPNMWDVSCGGHLAAGEDSRSACFRESKEELGIDLNDLVLEKLFTIRKQAVLNAGTFVDNEFVDVYLVEMNVKLSKLNFQKIEISELSLIDYGRLEELLRSNHPEYVPKPADYCNRLFSFLRKRYGNKCQSGITVVIGDYGNLLSDVLENLRMAGIDPRELEVDHIAYRALSAEDYVNLKEKLKPFGSLMGEKLIRNRPVAVFKLKEPLHFMAYRISCLEVLAPAEGDRKYLRRLEHAEFVVRDLNEFMKRYPLIKFDTKNLNRVINPEIILTFPNDANVKFHLLSIEEVLKLEGSVSQ